jgi:hypothetical protein
MYLKMSLAFRLGKKKIMLGLFNAREYYFEKEYRIKTSSVYQQLRNVRPDIIIANDIDTLPLAVRLKVRKTKIFFDAHEYHPAEMEELEEWRLNERPRILFMCKKYLRKANLMLTVSEPIASEYKKEFGVDPIVITNAPDYQRLPVRELGDKIRLVNHGSALKQRFLEETIGVMAYLGDDYSLDLILVATNKAYLEELKSKYSYDPRIQFREPVPTTQISSRINDYDIGVYILPPLNFNNRSALPNKFFEFIQARLAIAIGPMPAMSDLVLKYKLGDVAEEFSSKALAQAIKKMSRADIMEYKKNADRVASQLSAQKNKELLLNAIRTLN